MFMRRKSLDLVSPTATSPVLLMLLATVMCILIAYMMAIDQLPVVLLLIGATGAIFLVTNPHALFACLLVLTLVLAGMVKFFLPWLGIVWWSAYGMAAMLYASVILEAMKFQPHNEKVPHTMAAVAFLFPAAIIIISTVLNVPSAWQMILMIKTMIMFGGVWIGFANLPLDEDYVKKWLRGVLVIGLIQWPVAVYQFIFVRASRIAKGLGDVEASDSVVGTFGGSMEAGGLSAVLSVFAMICCVGLLSLHREKLLPGKKVVIFIILTAMPVLFMEGKVVFFYLPVVLMVLYMDYIRRKPMHFFGGVVALVVVMAGLLLAFQTFSWSSKYDSLEESAAESFLYSFQPNKRSDEFAKHELTRVGVIQFWWEQNAGRDPLKIAIGHGPEASRTVGLHPGVIGAEHFPLEIDRTGLSKFLWDFGVLGVLSYVSFIGFTFLSAHKLISSPYLRDWELALARTLRAAVPLFLMALLYRNDVPYAPPMMFLFMTLLGLISWLNRQIYIRANH